MGREFAVDAAFERVAGVVYPLDPLGLVELVSPSEDCSHRVVRSGLLGKYLFCFP